MVSKVQLGRSSSFLSLLKNVVNLVLGVSVLVYIVQSGYTVPVCLWALRIYSLVVVVVEAGWRLVLGGAAGYSQSTDTIIAGGSRQKINKSSKIAEISLVILWSIASVLVTYIITVLFGAHVIENFEETFTFSLLVASLAFIRPLIALGSSALLILLERLSWEDECEGRCMCVLAGAWLGAAPIPLDWDTPWQVWPLTCSIGALLSEIGASLFFFVRELNFKTRSKKTS